MTVTSTNQKVTFNGDGSTTVFAYNSKIFAQTDLVVILRVTATGTETKQFISTNYSVSGVGTASGGNVTMGTAPASGTTLTILRVQPNLQGLDLVPNDPFPAGNLEASLDKLTFMVQTHEEEIGRSIKASKANTITTTDFTISATDRANKVFAFDSSGDLSVTQELGIFRGNWAASTAYAQRDLVKDTSTANIFIVNTAHTSSGSQPLTTNSNAAKYDLIVDAASATTSKTAAASSATAAANSATASASSATTSGNSATASANSATTSGNSATTSGNSATASGNSATASANSATASANSATASANSATSAAASAADVAKVQGITNGTVAANKAMVVDANKDITGGRNLTITGELNSGGNLAVTGNLSAANATFSSASPLITGVDTDVDTRIFTIGGNNGNCIIDVDPAGTAGGSLFQVDVDNGEILKLTSAGAFVTGDISLISTDAGTSVAPILSMYRNSGSPAANDQLGQIQFTGKNASAEDVDYALIGSQIIDATNGSEDGRTFINSMVAGSLQSRIDMQATETVINNESIDLDFRVESDGNDNMLFVDAVKNSVQIGDGTAGTNVLLISKQSNQTEAAAHLRLQGAGYSAFHWLDATAYYIGQNASSRAVRIYCGAETAGVALTNGATSFGTFSDERLKYDIENVENAVDTLSGLRCVKYRLKDVDEPDSQKKIGLVAQDLVGVLDEVLSPLKRTGDDTDYMTVRYTEVVPVLVKAIQEQQATITALADRITALES